MPDFARRVERGGWHRLIINEQFGLHASTCLARRQLQTSAMAKGLPQHGIRCRHQWLWLFSTTFRASSMLFWANQSRGHCQHLESYWTDHSPQSRRGGDQGSSLGVQMEQWPILVLYKSQVGAGYFPEIRDGAYVRIAYSPGQKLAMLPGILYSISRGSLYGNRHALHAFLSF